MRSANMRSKYAFNIKQFDLLPGRGHVFSLARSGNWILLDMFYKGNFYPVILPADLRILVKE